jgi:hypothetical protein
MVFPEGLLPDNNRLLAEGLGLNVLAYEPVQLGEVVQTLGVIRMVFP